MNLKTHSIYILVIAILGFIAYNSLTKKSGTTISSVDTVYKIKDSVIYKKLKPTTTILVNVDTIKIPEDSTLRNDYIELLKKYYAKNEYIDTLYNKDSSLVTVIDTVFENRIISRKIHSFIATKYIENTKTIYSDSYKYTIGIGAILNSTDIMPSISYGKKNYEILVGYNLHDNSLNLGLMYKLNFR